ncbi:hypothetical protein Dimus_010715 [Dionaea muscipula]
MIWHSLSLAPPSSLKRRDELADWEHWLLLYPDALKKATERVRARRLLKHLTMAKMKDDEVLEKLGCRRSGRLSSPEVPAASTLGNGRAD